MMKKLADKKKRILAWGLLAVALLANLLYWGSRKEGYYCDELYSYHFVCQVDYPSINGGKDGQPWLDAWHTPEFFMDYFTITPEEAFDLAGTSECIRLDVHPPIYYLLLEMVCSVAAFVLPGVFSKWFGIFLNLGFFVLTIGSLYALGKRMLGSEKWAMASCALYGFSVGAVSTVVFIRMYMIFTFTCVLFSYWNILLWEKLWKGERRGIWRIYAALAATTVLGILNHYYFFLYAFFTCAALWGCALLQKNFRFALEYALVMAGGILGSYLLWPEMLRDILTDYRGVEAFDNLRESQNFAAALQEYTDIIASGLFGGRIGMGVLTLLLALLLLARVLFAYWDVRQVRTQEGIQYLAERKAEQKRMEVWVDIKDLFWVQLVAAAVCYVLLVVKIAPYRIDRYVFNVYPALALALVYVGKRLSFGLRGRRTVVTVMTGAMGFLILAGYWSPGVNYLYKGTEEKLQTVENHSHLPAFYVTDANSRYRVCGDSFFLSKAQHIYPVKEEGIRGLSEALEELGASGATQFLVYIDQNFMDEGSILNAVKEELGVEGERRLFRTQYSTVYVVE